MLTTALEAHAAGLCVIRARIDGTKAPKGDWKHWQTQRPDVEQLTAWFADGYPAMGVVCGEISGNLEMLELEGVAVVGGVSKQIIKLAKAAGIYDLVTRLLNGYYERTPSDGVHWLYRVEGAPVAGNTKLARRLATEAELAIDPDTTIKTLIETRGEGGFVVTAPSHGPTHPTHKPWVLRGGGLATIPTLTAAERDALFAVCRQIDTLGEHRVAVEPVEPTKRVTIPRTNAISYGGGDSWVDATCEHLQRISWDSLLGGYGWTYVRQDRHGSHLWARPGKSDGVSAWIRNDRINVFSTSTPLDSSDRATLDRLDVIAAYEHRGDRMAAARSVADAAGIREAVQRPTPPATTTNTATGEITTPVNLSDEFWNARPYLRHIRQAAHARTRSADAVLLFVLARTAALIPPTVVLPAVVGSVASLNFLGGIVSSSGGGKSTSGGVARALLPIKRADVVADVPPGSGEGLTELYFEWVMEEGPDGKNKRVKRKTKNGAFIYLDEGQALAEMGNRKGATLLPTLRSAWSGEVIGQSNATQETYRVLETHSYRMAIMVGFQLEYAAALIDDKAGGTPQRFVFATATDPSVPDAAPEWPGVIHVDIPNMIAGGTEMGIDAAVATEIRQRNLLATRGQYEPDALDTHADLVRIKVAALLALLDGRMDINAADWDLAHKVMRASNAVRGWVIEHARLQARRIEEGYTAAAIRREAALEGDATSRALISGAKSIARKIHRDGGTVTRNEASKAVAGKHRQLVDVGEMLAYATEQGWINTEGEGWKPGESRPA